MFPPFFLLSTFFTLVVAQSSDTALQLQAIQAHFSNAAIVPSLLSTFSPIAVMAVSFDGVGAISPGQPLTQAQVQSTPSVSVTSANTSTELGTSFTLTMVDAGPVGTDESKGQTRHWLVNGVTLSGSAPSENVTTAASTSTAITEYAGPAPPPGSGAHRYVVLLYRQPATFSPPANFSQPNIGVSVFNLTDYVQTSGLGDIVAGTYFTVEEGTASFTVSATSPVITSTLPAARPIASTSSSTTPTAVNANPNTNGASTLKIFSLVLVMISSGIVGFALL